MKKISIIGCGPGGQALAAHFSRKGLMVSLCALATHPGDIHTVAKQGGIYLQGEESGFVKIFQATTNLAEAIPESDAVFIVVPSFAQEELFQKIYPLLAPKTALITLEAHFSALVYLRLQRNYTDKDILYADISTLPYACRTEKPGTVAILGTKQKMGIACYPTEYTATLAKQLSPYFPSTLECYKNILEIGLNSLSGILHPAVALLNAGRIGEGNKEFYFYREGISKPIALLLERLDQERRDIGLLYGLELPYCMTIEKEFYGKHFDSIYEFYQQSQVHNSKYTLCPKSLEHRYISQDVPYVLVPWFCLGEKVGYKATIMQSLIDIACVMNHKDYMKLGRNLYNMCFDDNFLPVSKRKTYASASNQTLLSDVLLCG